MDRRRNRRCSKRLTSKGAPRSWSRSPKSSWQKARTTVRRSCSDSGSNTVAGRATMRPQSETNMTDRPASSVDPKLLEILVCPLTKGPLEYDREKQELISRSAKLAYPIRDGIPIMLPEEARRLD